MPMTDEELQAWRAKRTGKSTPDKPTVPSNSGGGPDAAIRTRDPVNGYSAPDFMQAADNALNRADQNNLDDDDDNAPAPKHGDADALRDQLAAAVGRTAPLQRQNEELHSALRAQQQQLADLQARLAEREATEAVQKAQQDAQSFDPFEGMTKDEIDQLDPTAAELIKKATRAAYAKAASHIKDPEKLIEKALAQRDQRARDTYMRATVSSLGLDKLSQETSFVKFLEEDDSASFLLNAFTNAPDLDTARSQEGNLRRMVKRFEKTTNSHRPADPSDRMSSHLDRSGGEGGGSSRGRVKGVSTQEEARQIRVEATRLMRARKFDEANKLLSSLNM